MHQSIIDAKRKVLRTQESVFLPIYNFDSEYVADFCAFSPFINQQKMVQIRIIKCLTPLLPWPNVT